ncbi:MAG: outer membrane protein assembly factor BamE [Betaproteobacteria bacterium]|nr:outer membrane protein assembly factor BamE [Betaproteobacteria bacterium]MDE2210750.1 outer membrane protein assembly factor BamE [Betaproteobacteria bacterium]
MIPIVQPRTTSPGARTLAAAVAFAAAVAGLGGCATADQYLPTWRSLGVYKIDINQGNYLSQDMVDKLKVGMTQQQVRLILGTPLIESPFRRDRWDYVYEFAKQGDLREHRNFTVWFADGKVTRWEGDKMPASVVELNRSAAAKALPPKGSAGAGWWDRLLDIFRKK